MTPRAAAVARALAALAIVVVALSWLTPDDGGSGSRDDTGTAQPACTGAPRFAAYDLGPAFEGHERTAIQRQCGPAGPVRMVSVVYGSCNPGGDAGCGPPVEVQSWPSCARRPAANADEGWVTVRGRRARFVGGADRLELATDDATIVVFRRSSPRSWRSPIGLLRARAGLIRAATALRATRGSPRGVAPDRPLPPPRPGGQDGASPCDS